MEFMIMIMNDKVVKGADINKKYYLVTMFDGFLSYLLFIL